MLLPMITEHSCHLENPDRFALQAPNKGAPPNGSTKEDLIQMSVKFAWTPVHPEK